ncbi:MipA/OmpV family protein [Alteromonas sp. RKMC-009]|nr:MipA/OmpV family protein [Alteromonas sp. RKMC-009]
MHQITGTSPEEFCLLKIRLFILICTLFTGPALAASGCNSKGECIDTGQWRVAAAVGAGGRTNPLRGGSTQSLVLIGDIAWYAESFYFDNFEFGYQWQSNQPGLSVDAYLVIDREARPFFSYEGFDATPAELFSREQLAVTPAAEANTEINVDSIADRRNGGHAGVRLHAGSSPANEWQFSVEKDIAGIHQGVKARIAWRFSHRWQKWLFSVSPQLVWNNRTFNDYYYGIDGKDTPDKRLWYSAGSGFRPGVNVAVTRQFNKHWGLLAFTRYQYLPDAVTESPLLTGHDILTVFTGLTYQF